MIEDGMEKSASACGNSGVGDQFFQLWRDANRRFKMSPIGYRKPDLVRSHRQRNLQFQRRFWFEQ